MFGARGLLDCRSLALLLKHDMCCHVSLPPESRRDIRAKCTIFDVPGPEAMEEMRRGDALCSFGGWPSEPRLRDYFLQLFPGLEMFVMDQKALPKR